MFIGRKAELGELEARWEKGRFEFGVVYGTRRIGKTTLLQEFVKGKNAFYYQARKADENKMIISNFFKLDASLSSGLARKTEQSQNIIFA